MSTKTVGGILTNLDVLLKETASTPVEVLLHSIEHNAKEIKFWLLVVPVDSNAKTEQPSDE